MNTDNKEIRKAEIRTAESGRLVSGYAVRFDVESVNIGFVEIIHRGAITDETISESDVFALLNHNEQTVLGVQVILQAKPPTFVNIILQ